MIFFNQFPVELLYNLFDYFLAHELLFTFLNINGYIKSILQSYSPYRINLKFIRKSDFNFIFHHIRSEQIIFLPISDESEIFDLS